MNNELRSEDTKAESLEALPSNQYPFFIVGCGRSGTTYLRSLLIRHPAIGIPLESLFMVDYLRASKQFSLEFLISQIVKEPEIAEWGLLVSEADLAGCNSVAEVIRQLHRLYIAQQGKGVWGQKTPRMVRHLDLLHASFPEAKIIHIIRDPRSVVGSLIRSDVHRSTAYHGALRWRRDVGAGLKFEQSHGEIFLRISYENLIRQPELTLRQVQQHIGVECVEGLHAYESRTRDQYSEFYANIHSNLDKPPMEANINRWQDDLTASQIEVVEAICGPLMQSLGYEMVMNNPELTVWQVNWARIYRSFRMLGQAVQYLRFRRRYLFHLIFRKWQLGYLMEFINDRFM